MILPSHVGFLRALLGFPGFYQVLLGFNGFYQVLLGYIGLYWLVSGAGPTFTRQQKVIGILDISGIPGIPGIFRDASTVVLELGEGLA